MVEALLWSAAVVALGEMGDKTQLLALLLAARFKRPWPIVLGIAVATLANHALAGAFGHWIAQLLGPTLLRWAVGLGFLAMAAWMLVPDRPDDESPGGRQPFGVFGTTVIAFFLAEMGDKTQLATVALAARYPDLAAVVFLGDALARKLPMALVHGVAALLFAVLGVLALLNVGSVFG
jgi:Ca2+/H+ antiporter, TMEM165/GDT1 family